MQQRERNAAQISTPPTQPKSFLCNKKQENRRTSKKQTNKSHARFLIHVSIIRRVCHNSMTPVFSISYPPPPPSSKSDVSSSSQSSYIPRSTRILQLTLFPFLSLSLFYGPACFFVFGCEIFSRCKRQIGAMTLTKAFSFGTF